MVRLIVANPNCSTTLSHAGQRWVSVRHSNTDTSDLLDRLRCLSGSWTAQVFIGFLDIFEVPRPVLEASWRFARHLGPLGGSWSHFGCILAIFPERPGAVGSRLANPQGGSRGSRPQTPEAVCGGFGQSS